MSSIIYLRGGGDLASGVALRLHRVGLRVLIAELPEPLVVRRLVSFAEAIFSGQTHVEDVIAERASNLNQALTILEKGHIPVLVDPRAESLQTLRDMPSAPKPQVLVDGRMTKRPPDLGMDAAPLVIGLGPGFVGGVNCHAVVETNRGHYLGRVIWQGTAEADTGIPEIVAGRRAERVLRAPVEGLIQARAQIGDHLEAGQLVAEVSGEPVSAVFSGILRGLLHTGVRVKAGTKIGDVDPRDDPRYCTLVSEKSLAVGGGVLEAILSRPELRRQLWD